MAGKLLIYEALTTRFRTVRFDRDPACALCGETPTIRGLGGIQT
jgi:adenylyltransferase/sulfurtransferase